MPRTKKNQSVSGSQAQAASIAFNGSSREVLTLAEAAAYLRVPEAEVVELVQSQGLPGRCIAGEWRFLRDAVSLWLATPATAWEARKAAILELAGKYKEDGDLERIVEDAYRQRGRPIARGSSFRKPST